MLSQKFGVLTTCLLSSLLGMMSVAADASPSGHSSHKRAPGKIFGLKHLVVTAETDRKLFAKSSEEWRAPIIGSDGSIAYVASGHETLSAVWIDSGKVLWSRNKLGVLGLSIHQHEDSLLVGMGTDLVVLDRYSGEERWRLDMGGLIGSAIQRAGHVAVIPLRPNSYVGVDLHTKKLLWRVMRPQPSGITVRGQAPATIDPKRATAYLGFSDGVVQAVNLKTGTLKWSRVLGESNESFADIDAQALLSNDGKLLVVASYNAGVFTLDTNTGKILSKNPNFKGISTWWAFNENQRIIAVNSEGMVFGFSAQAKKPAWEYQAKQGVGSAIVPIGAQWVGVSISSGPSVILDRETGAPQQLLDPGSGIRAPMAFRGQHLVVLSNKGSTLLYRAGE